MADENSTATEGTSLDAKTRQEITKTMELRNDKRKQFLEMIALHPRWGTNYRVRIAIVHNPATPLNIAIAFLHLLMTPELGAVGTDTRLNGIVQKRAAEILRRRRGSGTVRSSASSPP